MKKAPTPTEISKRQRDSTKTTPKTSIPPPPPPKKNQNDWSVTNQIVCKFETRVIFLTLLVRCLNNLGPALTYCDAEERAYGVFNTDG